MSQWDKLLAKICSLSANIRFEELQKVLESYGYKAKTPRGGSNHYIFRKPGYDALVIPRHKPVKRIYAEAVKEVIEREENQNENS